MNDLTADQAAHLLAHRPDGEWAGLVLEATRAYPGHRITGASLADGWLTMHMEVVGGEGDGHAWRVCVELTPFRVRAAQDGFPLVLHSHAHEDEDEEITRYCVAPTYPLGDLLNP